MKVTYKAKELIDAAYNEAKVRKHEYLTPEHLYYAALPSDEFQTVLSSCKVNTEQFKHNIEDYFEQKLTVTVGIAEPIKTVGYISVLVRAENEAVTSQREKIDVADILVSLYNEERSYGTNFLQKAGLKRFNLLQALSHGFCSEDSQADTVRNVNGKALEKYSIDLTALARENKLDPLIGREEELDRTIKTLCRRSKNNPIHVGDAGVGKTAITEGLAQRIVSGEIPPALKDFSIYSLDMGALVAGTKLHGVFEKRLKQVIQEILKKGKAILFIDEIHTLIGAGASSNSALDASNILKPALTSGKLRCIGATTNEEYGKYFEKDRALSRRFQKIDIDEPSEETALEILKGLKSRYENYHHIRYSDEALEGAVRLSARFVNDRRLPDKAIDVIDEAGAHVRVESFKSGVPAKIIEIDLPIIETVVSKIARIPERSVGENEKDKLKNMEETLKQRIFGQDEAVAAVVKAVKRSRAGFRAERKPVANFLFAGPTGVGKTELARQLAEILGIGILRFDMSEYQEKINVSKLIGSSPGYVGYEDGGQLTDAVRKQPHAVVLLDEIEKAHYDIYNILLQVMDYAVLTDAQGRKADFRNVILIMTSNAGAGEIGKNLIGFGDRVVDNNVVNNAVEKIFSPEFRNRLDAVIRFAHLPKEIMVSIVRKELDVFAALLMEKDVKITVTDACVDKLAEEGYSREFGARNVNRIIEEKIKTFFVDEVLFGRLSEGGSAVVDWRGGSYCLDILAEEIPIERTAKKKEKMYVFK